MTWSAAQYTKFESERNRPVGDLLARIPNAAVRQAADIGCGPGNSTELLRDRFPDAAIVGIDNSRDMIDAARRRLPAVRFEVEDLVEWHSSVGPFDVILANAVLQWVPNHAEVLPALMARLSAGGSLAVQMPDNLHEPTHTLMREIASDPAWRRKLRDALCSRDGLQSAHWYFEALTACGARVDVWRTTYHHPLQGAHAVVEWFKGSALRPYLEALDTGEHTGFLERYESAVANAYPAMRDGTVLLPFPRLFIVATLPSA